MEFDEYLAMASLPWESISAGAMDCISCTSFDQLPATFLSDFHYPVQSLQAGGYCGLLNESFTFPFGDGPPAVGSVGDCDPPFLPSSFDDGVRPGQPGEPTNLEECPYGYKIHRVCSEENPLFSGSLCDAPTPPAKKAVRQPSKNLMAERRRRKRLNDRLSMLRSVVPKISKMERTAILGDTIDYVKELLLKVNDLQEKVAAGGKKTNSLISFFGDLYSKSTPPKNAPKFEVESEEDSTRIDVFCTGKPGLLVSTMHTLESMGFEIDHCVISCFNDFGMRASCSKTNTATIDRQVGESRHESLTSEDVKQAMLRNAGDARRS